MTITDTAQALLNALEDLARNACHTSEQNLTSSLGVSSNADALKLLAQCGRFHVVHAGDRIVTGYWPEDKP